TLLHLHQEQLGFAPHNVMTFLTPPARHYAEGNQYWQWETAIIDKLRAVPGVQAVASVSLLPLTSHSNFPSQEEGRPEKTIFGMEIREVSPGDFDAMRIPLRRGRSLTLSDSETAPPVVVINEAVARQWYPDGDPLGHRLLVGWGRGKPLLGGEEKSREIVGVVADS